MELDWNLPLPLFPKMPGTLALSSLVQPPILANTSYAFKIYFSLPAYLDWGGGCPSFTKILAEDFSSFVTAGISHWFPIFPGASCWWWGSWYEGMGTPFSRIMGRDWVVTTENLGLGPNALIRWLCARWGSVCLSFPSNTIWISWTLAKPFL